jgi:multimeric flavodoxin WrbA
VILRLLHFSPSTATGRHDSHRACLGFHHFARAAAAELDAPVKVEQVWALPAITSKASVQALLSGADLLVIASPTYAQGSPWFVRRFLELGAGLQQWGGLGTAFATAGGQHTGGEMTVMDTLRSLQGLGLATFSFAQKYVVLGAQQKFAADGEFDLIDTWFLRQLARTSLVHLLARRTSLNPVQLAHQLGLDTGYYNTFPSREALQSLVGEIQTRLNAPLGHGVSGYTSWIQELGDVAHPPDATSLPFRDLLPEPPVSQPYG